MATACDFHGCDLPAEFVAWSADGQPKYGCGPHMVAFWTYVKRPERKPSAVSDDRPSILDECRIGCAIANKMTDADYDRAYEINRRRMIAAIMRGNTT